MATNRILNHEELVDIYVNAWKTLNADLLEPILSTDFSYGSMWVFEELKGKQAYMDYIRGKFDIIKRTKSVVEAKKGYSPMGSAIVVLLQDGQDLSFLDVTSDNGLMISAYMHDLYV